MRRLARFAARRPGLALAPWIALLALALAFGGDARERLHETDLRIPGSPADRAAELTRERFGATVAMAVLLEGPPRRLERVGPRVAARLARLDGVQVLSPWAAGGARVLREPRGQALLTLQVAHGFQRISDETTPAVERVLAQTVPRDVEAQLTGLAPLMRALNERSLEALDRGERLALPVLFVMLLVIFRSPVAALVPLAAGLLVTRIGVAAMGVLAERVAIDALALNMVTMVGLALGVDYSLLVVSRFREELAAGRPVADAVEEVAARAGRTVLFAGVALAVGMVCALLIAPGELLVSAALGVIVATVLAVLVALLAMPAGLALLGARVNALTLGRPRRASPWVAIAQRALRRPGAAAFFVLLGLVVMSAPVVALDTGPPHVANLAPDDPARRSFEAFERARGAGWATPLEVVFAADDPLVTPARLATVRAFQEEAGALAGVAAVLGPATLEDRAELLRRTTRAALSAGSSLSLLERGLRESGGGVGVLHAGLATGADGARRLADGLERAAAGAGALAAGAREARDPARRLADGVARTGAGARTLARSLARSRPDVRRLQRNLDLLAASLRTAEREAPRRVIAPLDRAQTALQAALRALGSASPAAAADPQVAAARQQLADALIELGDVATTLSGATVRQAADALAARELARGMRRLREGLRRLEAGGGRLDAGIAQAAAGADALARGIARLSDGAGELDAGLRALLEGRDGTGGARALARGLQEAVRGSARLGAGTQRLLDGVVAVRQRNDRQQAQLRRSGVDPERALDSGYVVLAAIDGAPPAARANAAFATDARRGGGTVRVMVVPRGGPFDAAAGRLRTELERLAARTARELGPGTRALVGGPAVLLDDFDRATTVRFPLLVAALVAVTFLVLLAVYRRPVLAAIAVGLNLLTVGAAVGVLIVCFSGQAPLLGGPGYLDAIALCGIFAVIFGLSIDYEVFLISRLLEGRERTASTDGAIAYGLERTATIITGAAVIMAAVFIAFAISPVTNTRQFGVGLTVAVALDATVVRLLLLPALVKLCGERTWWVPRPLQRRPRR